MTDERPRPGTAPPAARVADGAVKGERCDYCGAEALEWRKCKLVCGRCGNIVKSCADL